MGDTPSPAGGDASQRILMILGGYRDGMSEEAVKAFQSLAKELESLTRSVEPTEAMIEAGMLAAENEGWSEITDDDVRAIYLAMQSLSHKETMG